MSAQSTPACMFWGKYIADGPRWLPLTAHCLDVAIVFRALCSLKGIRRSLEHAAGRVVADPEMDRLAVLAALHDVGKANLGFQRRFFDKKCSRAGHIRELEPLLDGLCEHLNQAFVRALPGGMEAWFPDEQVAWSYLLATLSHHGRPLEFKGERTGTYWQAQGEWWNPRGSWDPMVAIADIGAQAKAAFPSAFEPGMPHLPSEVCFHHRFAGLVMLADWLGSHPHWFPVQEVDVDARLRRTREVVPELFRAVGLDVADLRRVLALGPGNFGARFGFPPHPLQAAIDALCPHDRRTCLVIAESETGSGKTEAALNWFFKLFALGKVDGLYFALPTRVAAREIYCRVQQAVKRWFPDPMVAPVTVLAVPGYAQVDGIVPRKLLPSEESANRWQDDEALRRYERQWAGERPKRFLAAPVAVGTVDQALLSAVQTTHAHLRSVCLDRSLLVVDEVHASDVYMSRLLESLLDHHLGTGGNAMLLSATLGARARHRFVTRVSGHGCPLPDARTAEVTPYPSVTLADGVPRSVASGCALRTKSVRFELLPVAFRPGELVGPVAEALSVGARVLVVMNTVRRAMALLRALESRSEVEGSWLFRCEEVVCCHHGRFAPADRVLLDARVTERFGPCSLPGPVVLVGTQTLEQSLDIDADLMVSDLAPADVLLQRVGRLHRHKRERPSGYWPPARCLVAAPEGDLVSALDERGRVASRYRQLGYGSVYEDLRILELTRRMLTEQPEVRVPGDSRRLVEAVTHPEHLASLQGDCWARHAENVEGVGLAQVIAAGHAAAVFNKYFGGFEFNEAGGKVVTRLGADNLQLPLDRPITSPFKQELSELVIPGHMAPVQPEDKIIVESSSGAITVLRCGDRRYQYSRYGLEEVIEGNEPIV